jgi:hypothetical protein
MVRVYTKETGRRHRRAAVVALARVSASSVLQAGTSRISLGVGEALNLHEGVASRRRNGRRRDRLTLVPSPVVPFPDLRANTQRNANIVS